MNPLQEKWDILYSQNQYAAEPAQVLEQQRFLLPAQGTALDLACGLGGNALLLAEAGLEVDAWDVSAVALAKLKQQATLRKVKINTQQCYIDSKIMPHQHYDVIVISRFLDRNLCNAIMAALKSGGLLFYQTFTRRKLSQQGPNNPDYLLAENELLQLFSPLIVVYYQELARIGNMQHGNRNEACFIGQKPLPEHLP